MSLDAKVLVTDPLDPAAAAILQAAGCTIVEAPDARPDTLRRLVVDADAIIVRSKLPDDLLDHGPRLRAVVRHGVGLDLIPVARATALGIPVAYVPGANAPAVAEYVFAALLTLRRPLAAIDRALRESDWLTARAKWNSAGELYEKCLGIVGLGNVGRRIAEVGAHGFAMRVLGHQRRLDAVPDFVEAVALATLFAEADMIVLACPLTPQTTGLVSADLIGRMKPTACLVNVARGPVVDEGALIAALRDHRIAGAVFDVFTEQPLARDHPYLTLDNVLLTPHLGGLTPESMRRMGVIACEETVRILRGERPVNFVNPEVWDAAQRRAATAR